MDTLTQDLGPNGVKIMEVLTHANHLSELEKKCVHVARRQTSTMALAKLNLARQVSKELAGKNRREGAWRLARELVVADSQIAPADRALADKLAMMVVEDLIGEEYKNQLTLAWDQGLAQASRLEGNEQAEEIFNGLMGNWQGTLPELVDICLDAAASEKDKR